MNNQRAATAKVGLLTVISLAVLITTVIWLRGRTLGGGQTFEIYFRDVDGLRQGAPVQFMGIRVGFVDDVMPIVTQSKAYRVRVRFTVTEPNVALPKGAHVSLQQSGIIGEKFVEIMPPRPQHADLILSEYTPDIRRNTPIMVMFRDGLVQVGHVRYVHVSKIPQILKRQPDYRYRISYIIDQPGYLPPNDDQFDWQKQTDGSYALVLEDEKARWQPRPRQEVYFTVEDPLRLKEFFEEQLASAQALKMTNEKINHLLSDETISTIQGTLKNSERLTAEAAVVLKQANALLSSTAKDLRTLVASTEELTSSVVTVTKDIDAIVGDPEVRANIQSTVKSLETSSKSLSALLNDPSLQSILSDAKATSRNTAELAQYLRDTAMNTQLQERLNESLTLMQTSLTRLSNILENVETVTEDKETLQSILQETREASQNLNRFSQRLNKRFLLFRLLF